MKTLMVCFTAVFVAVWGCGSDSTPPDLNECDQGYELIDGVCVKKTEPECWGDGDCPEFNKCIENLCIEKPECVEDEDCESWPAETCDLGTCKGYIENDQCYQQTCGEEGVCRDCGMYTICHEEDHICVNACEYEREEKHLVYDRLCADLTTCELCICWRLLRGTIIDTEIECDSTNTPAVYNTPCSMSDVQDAKERYASPEWIATLERAEKFILNSCD